MSKTLKKINKSENQEKIKYPPHVRNVIINLLLKKQFQKSAIAKILDITPEHLSRLIHRENITEFNDDNLQTELLKKMIENTVMKIVTSFTEDEIKRASFGQKWVGIGIGIEKFRLLSDKSTQNISVSHIIQVKRELERSQLVDTNRVIDITSDKGDYVNLKGQEIDHHEKEGKEG